VAQVNRAMNQVDQVTQRNAAAAEELSSTAEEMASQAESLRQLVGLFRVNAADGAPQTARETTRDHAAAPDRAAPGTSLRATHREAGSSFRPERAEEGFNGRALWSPADDQEFRRF
jgi:methyl-accepting chemotaxis protein